MSYGSDFVNSYRQAGAYAGASSRARSRRTCRFKQTAEFELVINLKAAKALGTSVSDKLLALASRGDRIRGPMLLHLLTASFWPFYCRAQHADRAGIQGV